MARTAVLGFPRIGPERELKAALEAHWAGRTSAAEVEAVARRLRAAHLDAGREAGIDVLPVGDFALYDHVLDAAAMAGLVAERHRGAGLLRRRARRGRRAPARADEVVRHQLPPPRPRARPGRAVGARRREVARAPRRGRRARRRSAAGRARAVLAAPAEQGRRRPARAAARADRRLRRAAGGSRGRARERCSSTSRAWCSTAPTPSSTRSPRPTPGCWHRAHPRSASRRTSRGCRRRRSPGWPSSRPPSCTWTWCARPDQLVDALAVLPDTTRLSAGVVDGRNVWATDPDRALDLLDRAAAALGTDRLTIAPSCSLLHVPYSAARETQLDPELRGWLAFGEEKLDELVLLRRALDAGPAERDELLAEARARVAGRRASARTHDPIVRRRAAQLRPEARRRDTPLAERSDVQRERLALPELPTTTIGSFPQTQEIRDARARHRAGALGDEGYERFIAAEIEHVDPRAGAPRPRRARARGAGAQRHGPVLRRAARRLRHLRARLGAVLRQPLREAADPLRRRPAPGADDRRAGGSTRSASPTGRSRACSPAR